MSKTCKLKFSLKFFAAAAVFLLASFGAANAQGIPHPWGLGLQDPHSPIAGRIYDFHTFMLAIITAIVVFVFILLVWVVLRYNKSFNKKPSLFTHNVKLEIAWTLIPCVIVLAVAWISFPLLFFMDKMPPPDLTLKVTGHQWYWSYEYPDDNDISFDSLAIWNTPDITDAQVKSSLADAEKNWLIKEDKPRRMIEVDNRVVLPVGKVVRVQITGADVEHSWFVPSLAVNRMAVPGRLNEVWLKIDKPGLYYGQCSMICGTGHGYMPIVIEGVPQDQFDAWVASKKS